MGLLDKFFKSTKTKTSKYLTDEQQLQHNTAFMLKFEQAKNLLTDSIQLYNSQFCQCAFPRFQQIVGIDCSATGNSFKCHDTDLLISLIKPHFDVSRSELTDEVTNEKWTCKRCGSTYEYGWSDLSIYVERQKLKLTTLRAEVRGLPTKKPIPLYLGLAGHSYPPRQEISSVSFDEFKMYLTEQ